MKKESLGKKLQKKHKRKMLWWSDYPTGYTGFSMVARHLLKFFAYDYDIDVLGINYDGNPHEFDPPIRMFPATSGINSNYDDYYGRKKLLDFIATGQYDLLWMMQDPFIVEPMIGTALDWRNNQTYDKRFVVVHYFPIDCIPKPDWAKNVISRVDFPVAYTKWGKEQYVKRDKNLSDIDVIYHGIDTKVFHPLPKEEIEEFKENNFDGPIDLIDRYIVLNVNRNQTRKDLLRTFEAFSLFKNLHPEALLFLLGSLEDQGGNLLEIASCLGLKYGRDWFAPVNYTAAHGYPEETVNMIYNLSDMVISTTLGEGFGLSVMEAMACKKPIVFPDHTSLTEILGEGRRGWLCPVNGDYICFGTNDNSRLRKMVNPFDFAGVMDDCYNKVEETNKKIETAYEWILTQTWKNKYKEWEKVMDKAKEKLHEMKGK